MLPIIILRPSDSSFVDFDDEEKCLDCDRMIPESFSGCVKSDDEFEEARDVDKEKETAELILLSVRRGELTKVVGNIDDLDCLR